MSAGTLTEVHYPTGDGKPMAETPVHRRNLTDSIAILEDWFSEVPDVYVSGNMLLYYEKGDKRRHVSPDVFVVLGVSRRERRAYFTWEEPKPTLDFVIELTSESTKDEDLRTKRQLYQARLAVREYLLFDPFQEYLKPPTRLLRLVEGSYVEVEPVDGRLPSEVLGLHIDREGDRVTFWDPKTRRSLPTPEERERERAEAAERRIVELEAQRAEREHQRAEGERQQAEDERQRADRERLRADAAEQRIAELEAELRRRNGTS